MDYVSQQSFIIYFSHSILINVLFSISNLTGKRTLWFGTSGMLVLFALTIAVSCFFAWICGMTPAAELLGGRRIRWKQVIDHKNTTIKGM